MKEKIEKLPDLLGDALPPVITIAGQEDFLKREGVQDILRSRYGDTTPPEECVRLQGDKKLQEQQLTELFDELRTPSLFGGDRTIIVDNATPYLKLDPDSWITVLKESWDGVLLVLVVDELDGRTKVAKALQKHGWLLQAAKPFHRPPPWQPNAPLWENDLNRWVCRRARKASLKIDPPTAHLLQTRIGPSLADLAGILERLTTVLGGKGTVTRELIEKHTPDGEESNLFELVDTYLLGDRQRTLALTRDVLHRGSVDSRGARITDASSLLMQFIGAALRRVRQLRVVHSTLDAGGDDQAVMQAAGIARPFLPRIKQQARANTPTDLRSIIGDLRRADGDLKSGRGPVAAELLERLAVR
ncbi:MAG: DNA polymerase III subunit delta [Planctomycetota bacterium]